MCVLILIYLVQPHKIFVQHLLLLIKKKNTWKSRTFWHCCTSRYKPNRNCYLGDITFTNKFLCSVTSELSVLISKWIRCPTARPQNEKRDLHDRGNKRFPLKRHQSCSSKWVSLGAALLVNSIALTLAELRHNSPGVNLISVATVNAAGLIVRLLEERRRHRKHDTAARPRPALTALVRRGFAFHDC